MPKANNMGTYTIPAGPPITIQAKDGVRVLALKLSTGGAATISGSAKIGALGDSTPIALVAGEPTVIANQDPIDGFVISCTAGNILVITNQ